MLKMERMLRIVNGRLPVSRLFCRSKVLSCFAVEIRASGTCPDSWLLSTRSCYNVAQLASSAGMVPFNRFAEAVKYLRWPPWRKHSGIAPIRSLLSTSTPKRSEECFSSSCGSVPCNLLVSSTNTNNDGNRPMLAVISPAKLFCERNNSVRSPRAQKFSGWFKRAYCPQGLSIPSFMLQIHPPLCCR